MIQVRVSLSARRAWIEMLDSQQRVLRDWVALRKESVDRNAFCVQNLDATHPVALRKESVDRNL